MALFDFLKKKEGVEKNEDRKKALRAPLDESPKVVEKKVSKASPKKQDKKHHEPSIDLGAFSGRFALITPHITERARMLSGMGQYTFRVRREATKPEIKKAVEKAYSVHVERVRITKAHEKLRRRGLTEGVKKGYKKAVVALRQGEAIDIF